VVGLGGENFNVGEVSESPLGGNRRVGVGGGGVCSSNGVCGSSSWEAERRCLVSNPRPPPNKTEFEEVDPRLKNNIMTLTAIAMIISSSRRDCSW